MHPTSNTPAALRSADSDALRELLDETSELVCAADDDGRVTYANRAFLTALGYTLATAIGLRAVDLVAPEDRERYVEAARRLRAGERIAQFEAALIASDGRRVLCRGRGMPVLVDDPAAPNGRRCIGTRACFRDVTAERQQETARTEQIAMLQASADTLRRSEAHLASIVDHAAIGITVVAPDGTLVAANAAFHAFLDYEDGTLVGQYTPSLSPAEDGAITREPVGELHAGRVSRVTTTKRFVRRDGTVRWAELTLTSMPLADGRAGTLGLVVDVTERWHAERERQLLLDVTRTISATPDPDAAIAATLATLVSAVGWEYGEAWYVDADGSALGSGAVWHAPDDERLAAFAEASARYTFAFGTGVPGAAWARRAPVTLDVLQADGSSLPRAEACRAAGLTGAVAVPVIADGEVIAVLAFHTRHSSRLTATATDLVAAVATQIGTVMRRALAERALRENEARLSMIYNASSDLIFLIAIEHDAAGVETYRCVSVNESYLAITGLTVEQVVGRTADEILPPDAAAFAKSRYVEAIRTGDVQRYLEDVALPTRRFLIETTLTPVLDDAGRCTHLLGIARDVTEREKAAAVLRESEARFRGVLETVRSIAVTLDERGVVTFANDALCALTGWSRDEIVGAEWFDRFSPEPDRLRTFYLDVVARGTIPPHFEAEMLTRDGDRRTIAWDVTVLHDASGATIGAASIGRDVTMQKASEQALRTMALVDELTGLHNRRGFQAAAGRQWRNAARSGSGAVLAYIDLNDFKRINDTFGHTEGDRALVAASDVLRATFRGADVIGRLGGDEFAVLVVPTLTTAEPGPTDFDAVERTVRDRLVQQLSAANLVARGAGRPYDVSLSVGFAWAQPDERTADGDAAVAALATLVAEADARLYDEKRRRRAAA